MTHSIFSFFHSFILSFLLLAVPLAATAAVDLTGIPDYSYCGYHASADTLPDVKICAYVPHAEGDMSGAIQAAIDYVSSLPLDKSGHRGTVLLAPGTYILSQRLSIESSGVVVRGAGRGVTILRKEGVDRGSLLRIEGRSERHYGHDTLWVNAPVKAGDLTLQVSQAQLASFVGREVEIIRQSSAPWIESVGCRIYGGGIDALAWKPGDIDLHWRRRITAIEGNSLQLDAPLTMGFDPNEVRDYIDNKKRVQKDVPFSPCYILDLEDCGEICESGIENLTLDSSFSPTNHHDENHCWTGISIEHARDCWVRLVDFRHLAGSGVVMQPTSRRITVEDCQYLEPVSENAGLRRTSFYIMGQQCLVQRCLARQGRHDFVTGFCAAGPNAFVQCEAQEALSYSGGLDSWACGTLYDIVDIDGHDLVMRNLGQDNNGAGWNAAASMAWQCTAAAIYCSSPDTLNVNRAYGTWCQFEGNGIWVETNNHIQPRSLYYHQLRQRLGDRMTVEPRLLPRPTDASSSPTVEEAMALATEARTQPRLTLAAWIAAARLSATTALPSLLFSAPRAQKAIKHFAPPLPLSPSNGGHSVADTPAQTLAQSPTYDIINGYLTHYAQLLTGNRYQTPWWNGKLRPTYLANPVMCRPALTRFVPDREGLGLTDRIDSVIAFVVQNDILAWDQNYGLWYDRRRDDHERVRRRDAAVWAPFWEQPWANTGQGEAWNRLSLYDLTQNNTWYYDRLQQFAQKAAPLGKLLYLEHYFQHNILEAGAHWVDSPWRPVNNVNGTAFPEPVPFAGDKRVFVADWFYDEQNATMADLHRQYIRRNLEAFKDHPNVIHYISEEYTGPLHFTRFWVKTIREWEQETGLHPLIALAATRDVQDSILADPELSTVIDIIDIRYWHYKTQPDPGSRKTWDDGRDIFDPRGGVNLAPRQHMRKQPVGKVTFAEAYRAVSEYRLRYPGKAVLYYAQNYPDQGWAVLMAGGSGANVHLTDPKLRTQLPTMQIIGATERTDAKVLAADDCALIYGLSEADIELPALRSGKYQVSEINPKTGVILSTTKLVNTYSMTVKTNHIYWIRINK